MIEKELILNKLPAGEGARISKQVDDRGKKLLLKLRDVFYKNGKDASNIAVYVAGKCAMSESTVLKVLNGNRAVTAEFLGRICVGLKLSETETKDLFELYGQPLKYGRSIFESVTICAVRDKDDIDSYVEELEQYKPKTKK